MPLLVGTVQIAVELLSLDLVWREKGQIKSMVVLEDGLLARHEFTMSMLTLRRVNVTTRVGMRHAMKMMTMEKKKMMVSRWCPSVEPRPSYRLRQAPRPQFQHSAPVESLWYDIAGGMRCWLVPRH